MEFKTLQLNLYDCHHKLMMEPKEMNKFLINLVKFIDMNIIPDYMIGHNNPNSFEFKPKFLPQSEHGVSGTLVMCESHISCHSFPEKDNMCNIVITSCKYYDTFKTVQWIIDYTKASIYKFKDVSF